MVEPQDWLAARTYTPERLVQARFILDEVRAGAPVIDAVRRHPLPAGGHVAKHVLVHLYRQLVESGEWEEDPELLVRIRMKPIRTLSGVTTVTVLTKPYPCPGNCIFCPTDECEPKSYLSDEPGARRALQNDFDPFAQVTSRLQALQAVGHPTDKIELLILGGTFTAYRKDYQAWFVHRCFQALNQMEIPGLPGADRSVTGLEESAIQPENIVPPLKETMINLTTEHITNVTSPHRNVGLVFETRPDEITYPELTWLRELGATKLQIGAQSMDDRILTLNNRGHTVEQTVKAMLQLRASGFKVVLHWMPNLLGSTPESDLEDFKKLWGDKQGRGGLCPDEIKIYPTQLLRNSELYHVYLRGEYKPYTEEQLVKLLADVKILIPSYCRVNRIIRDIPSNNVVEGNRRTSLRQDALLELEKRGQRCRCIRCREVRGGVIELEKLTLSDQVFFPAGLEGEANSTDHFLSYVTDEDRIAGYLRLSLPFNIPAIRDELLSDLAGAAIIREVHVYGQSLPVGGEKKGAAQHIGLGKQLIEIAAEKSRQAGYNRLAVISAIGTRDYYRKRGFTKGSLYQLMDL
ncbi:MAG: tRNA uridine(34) 5-carboxymethylaminomethyl modification radical SAM/GNAT enzyme Elp3 [Anaerolinea sp.]|nr:tRNA uridine(34) 5-carboxymethylaminomethyl modification radical SAM/GNAT enzyme Elp3 [Anaerolinea sp.]